MWLQHYSDHLSWHLFFFFFTISDEIIGLQAVRLNAPTISNRDGQLSGRLPDSRSAVQLVSQRDGQTSGPADQWVRQPTCRPASVSASDQCISSVSTAESSPTVSDQINWPGLKPQHGFLTSLKTISKILNMTTDLHIRCFLHSLNYLAALEVQASGLRTNTLHTNHTTPPLRRSYLDLPTGTEQPGSSLKIQLGR